MSVTKGSLFMAFCVGLNVWYGLLQITNWQTAVHFGVAAALVSTPLFIIEESYR